MFTPKLTHITFAVNKMNESLSFYRDWLGLEVHLDRRPKGRTVWLKTNGQVKQETPDFVFVLHQGEVSKINHFGFQVDTRAELDTISAKAKLAGILIEGPIDVGGLVGSYVLIEDPNGHIWEFTYGQPLIGL